MYTCVEKFKAANEPVAIYDTTSMQAALRRTREECAVLKKGAA